jgi:hypothetical protein
VARNGFSGSIIVCLGLLCLPMRMTCQQGSDSVDRSLAAVYLDQAIALHEQGDDAQAFGLLRESLSISGKNSDTLYLMSKIDSPLISADYSLRASKAARLDAALDLGDFGRFSREDAAYELADCLLSMREYDRAALTIRHAFVHPELEARSALILVECDFFMKRMTGYRNGMGEALRRFPDDARFSRYFLEHANQGFTEEGDKPLVAFVSKRLEALVALDPETLVLMLPFTPLKADRVKLIRRYRSLGLGSLRSLIEVQRYGAEAEAGLLDEFWKRISADASVSWNDLREFFGLLTQAKNRTAFLDRLGSYTGTISEDRSGDGIAESVARFKDGELQGWEYDPDQDRQTDISLDFGDGLPVSARCLQQGKSIILEFSQYPVLRSASYAEETGSAKLDFGSGGTSLPIVAFKLPFRAEGLTKIRQPVRDESVTIPDLEAAIPLALSIEETERLTNGRDAVPHEKRTVTELRDGLPLRKREFVDGKISLQREYDRGIPTQERFGYNDEGKYWEGLAGFERTTSEPYYRKAWLSLDADGNGLAEYRESYFPTLRKQWDFDDNGSFDVAEEERDGAIIDSFSSKLNGEFDVRVETRSGKIVSVHRNGKDYPVRKESAADIYWIGSKPFELGTQAPVTDGLYNKAGVRYLFYRSGKIAFAETIP